ncbi:MAG: hypothetical protein ACXW13_00010 [Burkholderiaceae bacterium]
MKLTDLDRCELETFILGDKLGEGVYRDVYVYAPDPSYVIKVEKLPAEFANAKEWGVWQELQFNPLRKWLAPCLRISQGGVFLVQKRTMPITKADMPKRIPSFLTDEKAANWGRLGRQIVCHDYAHIIRDLPGRLRKPRTWT